MCFFSQLINQAFTLIVRVLACIPIFRRPNFFWFCSLFHFILFDFLWYSYVFPSFFTLLGPPLQSLPPPLPLTLEWSLDSGRLTSLYAFTNGSEWTGPFFLIFLLSFNRHKLYTAYPKSQADVNVLDNLLKEGVDGVSVH